MIKSSIICLLCVCVNAGENESYSEYTKADSKEQGHAFKKITGNADAYNVFPKIAINFSDKFLRFLVDNDHEKVLSFVSIGERQSGETAAEVTEMMRLIATAGGIRTEIIILRGLAMSSEAAGGRNT